MEYCSEDYSPSGAAEWGGLYREKPVPQQEFDNLVRTSVAEIMAAESSADLRPYVKDKLSKRFILIDSGAAVTIVPKPQEHGPADSCMPLRAANGALIQTYGYQNVKWQLGGGTYAHRAVVASVTSPILGFDFLQAHKLSLVWSGEKCFLQGEKGRIRLKVNHSGPLPNLAPVESEVSFQKWSQKCASSTEEPQCQIPSAYAKILAEYPNITKVDFTKPPAHGIIHEIDTSNHKPCKARVRPVMPGSPKAVQGEKAWREMDRLGIIRKCDPAKPILWSSALHLQPKADGTIRCCGDFRALNHLTELDVFPLPNIRNFSGLLKDAKVFSKVDLVKAYFQLEISEDSKAKTTTVTPWGCWEYNRLPMGLKNSAASFQRLMMHVLDGVPNIFVYLDDILVYTKDEMTHQQVIRDLLSRLDKAGLAISLKKCLFSRRELDFLGYRVSPHGLTPLPRKIEAITSFPTPKKPKQLLGFLGAANYYRRCFPKLNGVTAATILQPLYDAATTKQPTKKFTQIWEEKGLQKNFDQAKELISLACTLTIPDPAAPLSLSCDSSGGSIGGVLEQFTDGLWRPLGFFSRHLKPNQKKWSCFRRELFAMQQSVRHFNVDIAGRHFTIWSDHRPIIEAFKNPNAQCHDNVAYNHLMEVSQFTADVRYLPGRQNCIADLMSRPSQEVMGTNHKVQVQDEEELVGAVSAHDVAAVTRRAAQQPLQPAEVVNLETVDHLALAQAQQDCPDVVAHRAGQHPRSVNMADVEFTPGNTLFCEISTGKSRPFIPKTWRGKITPIFHMLNHPGPKATLKKVESRYYWPSMAQDVTNFVKSCHNCQAVKASKTIVPPMSNRPILAQRFQEVQIDIVGPLVASEGFKYLLTVVDRCSRYFDAIPMTEATSANCARAFIRHWVRHFGLPTHAQSDCGSAFLSNMWKDLHEQLGTIVSYSPVYRPAANGHIERQHKELKHGLKAALIQMGSDHGRDWASALPWVLLGRSTTYQPDIDASPSQLVFGSEPRLPGDLAVGTGGDIDVPAILKTLKATANRKPAQTAIHSPPKTYFPEAAQKTNFVYMKNQKTSPLSPRNDGPYPIVERVGKSCVRLEVGEYSDGTPRLELHHWANLTPADVRPDGDIAVKPTLGRPKSSPSLESK